MIWRSGKLKEGKWRTLNTFNEKHWSFPFFTVRRLKGKHSTWDPPARDSWFPMAMSAGHACDHRSAGTKHLDSCRNSPGIHSSSCSSHKPGPSSLRLIWKSTCFRVSVWQPCYLRTHWLSSGSGTLTSFWVACQSRLLRCRTLAKDPHFAFQQGECWLTVNFIRPAKGRTKPPSTQTMPLRRAL